MESESSSPLRQTGTAKRHRGGDNGEGNENKKNIIFDKNKCFQIWLFQIFFVPLHQIKKTKHFNNN